MGMVELLDQPAAISQSDLDVSCGLGGVEGHGGAGLSLVGGLVLLGQERSRRQLRGGAGYRETKSTLRALRVEPGRRV